MRRLSKNQDPSLSTTIQHLERFACSGYRTLCIAERELEQLEYDNWAARFLAASVALDEREEKLAQLADFIERELVLLGVTAVEDKLQEGVPETVTLLAHAGIKIWVLTGDKLETAVSIGLTSNLLVESIHLFLLSEKCLKSIPQMLTNMLEEATNKEAAASGYMAMVIEGDSLTAALEEDNKQVFLDLCQLCRTVICCRVSPMQKARVAKILRDNGAIILAIGDGANDMAMLQTAHIGVGICGRQVMKASNYASNYAISQFRFLARLLLVHGRWSYKRNRDMILYAFYKNIVYVGGNCYLAFYSAFSGQALYNIMLISTYNLLWTSLPTIAYGIFDKDVTEETILNNPQLYHDTQEDKTWSLFRSFALWFVTGVYHSLIVYFYPSSAGSLTGNEKRGGLSVVGASVYTLAVFVVNMKLATRTHNFTWISHVALWVISIGLWLVYLAVLSISWRQVNVFSDLSGAGTSMCASLKFWLVILLGIVTALLPDMVISVFRRHLYPKDNEIMQEMEHGWRDGVRKKQEKAPVEQVTRSMTMRAVSLPKTIMQHVEQVKQLSHTKTIKADSADGPPPRRITWRDVLSEKEIEDIDIPDTLSRYGKRRSSGFQVVTKFSDDEDEELTETESEHHHHASAKNLKIK